MARFARLFDAFTTLANIPEQQRQLPTFPRREPAPTCEEWQHRLPPMGPPPQ